MHFTYKHSILMERLLMGKLRQWKTAGRRLPLILQGTRQVGKTWLLQEFGRQEFDNVCYVNFEQMPSLRTIFDGDLTPQRIIDRLSLLTGAEIHEHSTLIIFDEVQEVPRALTSLKYFAEQAPGFAICCAGSLLGVALHRGTSYPVGKVDFLRLEPMTFNEFLTATGHEREAQYLSQGNTDVNGLQERLIELLKTYLLVGGMPAAVQQWINTSRHASVRQEHERIITSYENDFSKHSDNDPSLGNKCRLIWRSLPAQLARENKKFIYGKVREGSRAREYENALLWLHDAGMIRMVYNITKPDVPLRTYCNLDIFKCYIVDVGLLATLSGLAPAALIDDINIFEEFKGAIAEQFVLQQLSAIDGLEACYYWTGTTSEVDFVLTDGQRAIPIEVKSGTNLRAKSMATYIKRYEPPLALRLSLNDPKTNGVLHDLPLYAISALPALLSKQ